MAKKIRIKDIAETAGVSPGTVDRVLHNRGDVSPASRQRVEEALRKMNYRPNIHVSALSMKKKYRFAVTMPEFSPGEYWESIEKGIRQALEEYAGLDIDFHFLYYDQFDLYSCRSAFERVIGLQPEAVIIGPTFRDETLYLGHALTELNIPYVFVDSMIDGTAPLAFFTSHSFAIGALISRLLTSILPEKAGIALFQAVRTGDESANTTILRKSGFMAYIGENNLDNPLHKVLYSAVEPEKNNQLIGDFFERNPQVRGAVIFNSRGSMITDYFRQRKIKGVKIICVDLIQRNVEALKAGYIEWLLGQRPQQQGYMAVKALFEFLVYGTRVRCENYMPIDIVARENVDFYSEFQDITLTK
ncbi:MAG: LacI family transcriptional regulator [Rikenellaceae bacterium]|nr:LacI family transcriptional regulator [Rikenellaceae bacterium]